MKQVTINANDGEGQMVTFVGWRRDRISFYVLNQEGASKVVELWPAYSHNLDTGEPFGFPKLEPTEIFPARLSPPLCVANKEAIPDMAKISGETVLFPQRKHEQALRRALLIRRAKADKAQTAEIARVKGATVNDLFPFDYFRAQLGKPNPPHSPEAIEEERQRKTDEIRAKYKAELSLTLDDMKAGLPEFTRDIRDQILIETWAKETGIDLNEMRRKRAEFVSQWRKAFGVEHQCDPQQISYDRDAVKFGIRFGADVTFYVHGFKIRNILTPDEAEDFEKLRASLVVSQPTTWHTGGFATIRRIGRDGAVIATLPLANEMRALCQLLAERADQIAQFSEIEPLIGTRANQLDTAARVNKPAEKGERRVRDLLRTQIGRQLVEWGVLKEIKKGREKFLQLRPPAPLD